jgi:copper chaperone CopZ
MRHLLLFIVSSVLLASSATYAGTVSVKGPHLCCGGCQTIADAALSEVDGVSNISCDLNTKVISYKAESDKAAEAGIKALAGAGFFGTATHDKKPLKYPVSGAKKGMKANTILLSGVHLCCTACVTASQKALEGVKGVTLIDIDRNEKTIKLTGDAIGVPDAIAALNKAGFYCRLPEPKK